MKRYIFQETKIWGRESTTELCLSFSGIMSTVMSQPPPKEDEEEEDEEHGEEFTFEDTDEEKLQEDGKGIESGAVGSVQVPKQGGDETSDGALKTDTGSTQTSPPAGQEGAANTDVASVSTAGKHLYGCWINCSCSLVEISELWVQLFRTI